MKICKSLLLILLVVMSLTSCNLDKKHRTSSHDSIKPKTVSDLESYSDRVTIYRDAYGVPHIYGETDGDSAFGMAYAQAEDNFKQLELNFILATGRAAEIFGEESVLADWIVHAFQSTELSKRDYENASPEIKALLDGYAAGLNYYLKTHPEINSRLIEKFEPWYPLALIRQIYYIEFFLRRIRFSTVEKMAAFEFLNHRAITTTQLPTLQYGEAQYAASGSNSWAANGDKTKGNETFLFINPHLPAFGMGQVYEAHVMSDQGWNFTGYTRFGFPLPYVGFGENLGWASTDNYADQEDAWIEHFDRPEEPLAYKYGIEYKQAVEWEKTIKVKDLGERTLKFRKTHRGPIVAIRDGALLTAKFAKYEKPGWLEQWYAMSKAKNFTEFLSAVEPLNMQFGNYMYADREGNILYVYNGAIPKRDSKYDWKQPLDGSDKGTEWQGYHDFTEIPQVLNPVSHFMQNSNTTPFLTSMSESDPKKEDFPDYLVREGDNARSQNARRILQSRKTFDFATWEKLSFDTTIVEWQTSKKLLMNAYKNVKTNKQFSRLAPVIELLAQWDGVTSLDSVETAIYLDWSSIIYEQKKSDIQVTDEMVVSALLEAQQILVSDWGTWKVRYGDINRAQRPRLDEKGKPQFCDECKSIPSAGVPHWSGGSQIDWNRRLKGLKKRYKRGGNSYTAIVAFPFDKSKAIESKSVHVFGASADENSPHYMDQAVLLSQKRYKRAWLYLEDVKANAVTVYKPGEED